MARYGKYVFSVCAIIAPCVALASGIEYQFANPGFVPTAQNALNGSNYLAVANANNQYTAKQAAPETEQQALLNQIEQNAVTQQLSNADTTGANGGTGTYNLGNGIVETVAPDPNQTGYDIFKVFTNGQLTLTYDEAITTR